MSKMMVFTGNANPDLARRIVRQLHIPLGDASVGKFSDGEVMIEINENVRGKDVFVVQPTCAAMRVSAPWSRSQRWRSRSSALRSSTGDESTVKNSSMRQLTYLALFIGALARGRRSQAIDCAAELRPGQPRMRAR